VDPDDTDTLMKMAVSLSLGRDVSVSPLTLPSTPGSPSSSPSSSNHTTAERGLIRIIALDLARAFVAHQHVPLLTINTDKKEMETKTREEKTSTSTSTNGGKMIEAVDRLPLVKLLLAIIQEGDLNGDDAVTVVDSVARELLISSHAPVAPLTVSSSSSHTKSDDPNALPASTQLLSILFLAAALCPSSPSTTPTSALASAAARDEEEKVSEEKVIYAEVFL
jgi:hypothetical protein